MRAIARLVMLTFWALTSCMHDSVGSVTARPGNVTRDHLQITVSNGSSDTILLIAPASPNRQVDEQRCTLLLSTKVQEWIRPYAFTPELVELNAGDVKAFSVKLEPSVLTKCPRLQVDLEYAFVRAEAEAIRSKTRDELRAYLLKHQQIADSKGAA